MFDNDMVSEMTVPEQREGSVLRKARGAFFTPAPIARFLADWAVRTPDDRVIEPSVGEAAFLVAAVDRLRRLAPNPSDVPVVDGVEIHPPSARVARGRVRSAGGDAQIREDDFFLVEPTPEYDAVVGNPPFIRYQEFTGEPRRRAREAALRAGVVLTGLASSWAAFTVHAALFLRPGGRLALVLPAELLSVNYASAIRRFLVEQFAVVELVLFDERVFPEAETDVVLLLADGYAKGPTDHVVIHRARNAGDLFDLGTGERFEPPGAGGKWTGSLVPRKVIATVSTLLDRGRFTGLETWGDTTLGIVTGNNRYFTFSPRRAHEVGIDEAEMLPLSPPGSAHLRGLALTPEQLVRLGEQGGATRLFYPATTPSPVAQSYIDAGVEQEVHAAYKCRVRKIWYRVPLVPPADLLLTCMNADTPRLTTNEADAHHLNSVHGVYLHHPQGLLGRELLPLASLNSVTLLDAELVGRAYGGGILKLEPKEADGWAVPSPALVAAHAAPLRTVKDRVDELLAARRLLDAVRVVDEILLLTPGELSVDSLERIRSARAEMARRRAIRSSGAR